MEEEISGNRGITEKCLSSSTPNPVSLETEQKSFCSLFLDSSPHDLPWVPKGRFKELLIQEGKGCKKMGGAARKKYCRLGVWSWFHLTTVQFSLVAQCPTLCDPMDCMQHTRLPCPSPTPRTWSNHVHKVGDAIQPSHPLSSSSPPAFNLSQPQGLFQWVSSSHQVAWVLEFQLQHQSFQWIFRTDLL